MSELYPAKAIRIKDMEGIREGVIHLVSVPKEAACKAGWEMREDVARQKYHLLLEIDETKAINTQTERIVSVSPTDKRYTLM